ncbi:hypothetical protein RJ498_001434 [Pluralibacter gergoviae]
MPRRDRRPLAGGSPRADRIPVFSLGISAVTTRHLAEQGEINTPLRLMDVQVQPGDLALGDDDGVFIINARRAAVLLPQLLLKEQQDRYRRAQFLQRLEASR